MTYAQMFSDLLNKQNRSQLEGNIEALSIDLDNGLSINNTQVINGSRDFFNINSIGTGNLVLDGSQITTQLNDIPMQLSVPGNSGYIDFNAKSILLPRVTTTQRNNINAPPLGLICYDTDLDLVYLYNGSWVSFTLT